MVWALLISLLWLGPGDAQVEWGGDDSCPGAELELERALDDYVGEGAGDAVRVAARVVLFEVGGGIELSLTIESEAGRERHELVGLGCEQLVDQAALLLAGVIDPFLYAAPSRMQHEIVPIHRPLGRSQTAPAVEPRAQPEAPKTQPAQQPEPELEAATSASPRATSTPDTASPRSAAGPDRGPERPARSPALAGTIGVGAVSFVGLFPGPGGGVQLDGALERGAFRWQSALAGYFGGRFRVAGAEVGADLSAMGISTGFCGVPGTARIQVRLCGLAGAGFVSARAVGTSSPGRSTQPWVHAGGDIGLGVLARPVLAVVLGVGVHAALVRPGWEVRGPDGSFAVPPVMGLVRLSVEIRGLARDQNTKR